MFKVDKAVPMPVAAKDAGSKYPWGTMAVGDSFFIPGKETKEAGSIPRVRIKYGERHIVRSVVENGVKGVRIWRIK